MLRPCSVVLFFCRNRSRAQVWCKFCEAQLPKVLRTCQFLTILTSESLSRAGVVQILRSSTPKVLRTCQFLTILTSKSLSRAGVVQILLTSWAADPSQLPFLGPAFASLRSHETMEKHSISRNSYPPKSLMSHICAVKPAGNFQYSRKLELLNLMMCNIPNQENCTSIEKRPLYVVHSFADLHFES